jgi:alpha-tubulin suppressor-like RCC1 family protein
VLAGYFSFDLNIQGGRLGIGTTTDSNVPVELTGGNNINILQVSLGNTMSISLNSAGNLFSCGYNDVFIFIILIL